MNSTPNWFKTGKDNIWYPYTQMKTAKTPIIVKSTKNCTIELENGKKLIDGISSWWSSCHGYNHPYINKAVKKQLDIMPHIMFAGTAHEQAYKLAHRLCKLAKLDKVFFTDSGSTAVETAMKIAVQYWQNQKMHTRNKFISFKNGYHGDTMGCMSLCDPDSGMHKSFNHYMTKQYNIAIPSDEYQFSEFNNLLKDIKHTVAAIIIEPLVQGAGGMKFHSPDILAEIYRICKKNDILFIADEIMTGFYRTGEIFASHEAAITPDIMCIGKALTGGTLTLAATMVRDEIFNQFYDDKLEHALMSGPTFMANPLACAAANASLDLFEQNPRKEQVENIEKQLYEELAIFRSLNNVKNVRIKGAIGVIQLKKCDWEYMFDLREKFVENNIWLRPFSDIIYIMPALTISKKELSQIINITYKLIK